MAKNVKNQNQRVNPKPVEEVSAPKPEAPKAPEYATVVNCVKLRLRKAPNAEAEVLRLLDVNDKVLVITKGPRFCKVAAQEDSMEGFVMTEFLQF